MRKAAVLSVLSVMVLLFFGCNGKAGSAPPSSTDTENVTAGEKPSGQAPESQDTEKEEEEEPGTGPERDGNGEGEKKRVLLIVMEDRSGSTSDLRKFTTEKYRRLFETFAEKYCGQIAVRAIGNPKPEEKNFYLVDLDCPEPLLPVSEDLPLDKRALVVNKNRKITQRNQALGKKNRQRIGDFIQTDVVPHIINYKPHRGRDVTDIRGALEHLAAKLSEAQYGDYDEVQVLIVSDGVHDADRRKVSPMQLKMTRGRLYLIGWEDPAVFQGIRPMTFESIDGFISYYRRKK